MSGLIHAVENVTSSIHTTSSRRWLIGIGIASLLGLSLITVYIRQHRPVKTWQVNGDGAIAISPDDRVLAVVTGNIDSSRDEVVEIRNIATGEVEHSFQASAVVSLAFDPQGELLAAGGGDGDVWLWDVKSGVPVRELQPNIGKVNEVAFSPDGSLLAIGGGGLTTLLRVSDGTLVRSINDYNGITRLAFSPDGQFLVTTGTSKYAAVWRISDGQMIRKLVGAQPTDVAYSPDEEYIAVSSAQQWYVNGQTDVHGQIAFWSTRNNNEKPEMAIDTQNEVFSIIFSPDGKHIAVPVNPAPPRRFYIQDGIKDFIGLWPKPAVQLWRISDLTLTQSIKTNQRGGIGFVNQERILVISSEKSIDFWKYKQ